MKNVIFMLIIAPIIIFCFQYIITFSWLHVFFLRRSSEPSTLLCLHPFKSANKFCSKMCPHSSTNGIGTTIDLEPFLCGFFYPQSGTIYASLYSSHNVEFMHQPIAWSKTFGDNEFVFSSFSSINLYEWITLPWRWFGV
jgi:hypothetical protein